MYAGVHTCTCTCNSCLMVFTVYGICTARTLYVLPRAEPKEAHTVRGRYYLMHCKNHETAVTDGPYKVTAKLASAPEYTCSTYCTLAIQCKVAYARQGTVAILV